MSSTLIQTPSREQSVLDQQFQWHKKSLQGCAFAGKMANEAIKAKDGGFYFNYWARRVLGGHGEDAVRAMMEFVAGSHLDEQRQIASLLFPDVTTREHLVALMQAMRLHYVGALIDIQDCPSSPHTLVRIRLPLSDGITAYALGFGQFDWMPVTRQAPYTELVLPLKTKQQLQQKYQRHSISQSLPTSKARHPDPTFVHLADVQMEGITNDTERDSRFWENTQAMKLAKLNNVGLDLAKGKITFSFPGSASQFAQT
jgi:hypothetical protein